MESFTTDFSEHALPYSSWATQEDPYQLMNCVQGVSRNRNIDLNDCGSEADLYGLVSTILEDVDPMDSYFSQEISSGPKTVWSPIPMKEGTLQYLNSEMKMLSSSNTQSNNFCTESKERDSNQNSFDIYPHCNGFDIGDLSWNFSGCNGESESYTLGAQDLSRPPPGLSIPSVDNTYLSKSRPGKFEYDMSGKDHSFCSSRDVLSENMDALNESCYLPEKINDSYFSPYQDISALSRPKMTKNRSIPVLDPNKLITNIQALLMGEQDDIFKNESQNNLVRAYDENIIDPSLSSQQMPSFVSHMSSYKREMTGSFREQRGGEVEKNQLLQSDYNMNEFSGFGQMSDYFEPSKTSFPFNSSTLHHSNEVSHSGTSTPQNLHQCHHGQTNQLQCQTKLPANTTSGPQGISRLMPHSVSEYVPHLSSQPRARVSNDIGQGSGVSLQGRMGQAGLGLGLECLRNAGSADGADVNLQLDKGRLKGSTSTGHFSQQFGQKPKSSANFLGKADKNQGLLQNPYQSLGSAYAGQKIHNGATSSQVNILPFQMYPHKYQVGVPRQNPCHLFPSHSILPCRASVALLEMRELLPDKDVPTSNSYLQELIGLSSTRGDGPFSGLLSTIRSSKLNKICGAPMNQLHLYLEDCYEHWRLLEKERKRTETILVKSYPGKCLSVVNTNCLPKMPPNPSRVDRLIVDQLREHTKVVSLLGKMERLRSFPLHANICSALDRHLEAIYITQARRKDELLNSSTRHRQGKAYLREDREILILASALKDLSSSTRKSRTALWCALQMTLPKTSSENED